MSRSPGEMSMKNRMCTGIAASRMQRKKGEQETSGRKLHQIPGLQVCQGWGWLKRDPESAAECCLEGWWGLMVFIQGPRTPQCQVIMTLPPPVGLCSLEQGWLYHVTLTGKPVHFLECQYPHL